MVVILFGGTERAWKCNAYSALSGLIEMFITPGSGSDHGPQRGRVFGWFVQASPA